MSAGVAGKLLGSHGGRSSWRRARSARWVLFQEGRSSTAVQRVSLLHHQHHHEEGGGGHAEHENVPSAGGRSHGEGRIQRREGPRVQLGRPADEDLPLRGHNTAKVAPVLVDSVF